MIYNIIYLIYYISYFISESSIDDDILINNTSNDNNIHYISIIQPYRDELNDDDNSNMENIEMKFVLDNTTSSNNETNEKLTPEIITENIADKVTYSTLRESKSIYDADDSEKDITKSENNSTNNISETSESEDSESQEKQQSSESSSDTQSNNEIEDINEENNSINERKLDLNLGETIIREAVNTTVNQIVGNIVEDVYKLAKYGVTTSIKNKKKKNMLTSTTGKPIAFARITFAQIYKLVIPHSEYIPYDKPIFDQYVYAFYLAEKVMLTNPFEVPHEFLKIGLQYFIALTMVNENAKETKLNEIINSSTFFSKIVELLYTGNFLNVINNETLIKLKEIDTSITYDLKKFIEKIEELKIKFENNYKSDTDVHPVKN